MADTIIDRRNVECAPTAKRIETGNSFILGIEFICPECHATYIDYKQHYCNGCGCKFIWNKWEVEESD